MPSIVSNPPIGNNETGRSFPQSIRYFHSRLLQRTLSSLDLNEPESQQNSRYIYGRVSEEESVLSDSSDEDEQIELFPHSPIDLYRLAVRTNSEILDDLTSIIRILRQMNGIHRIFNRHHHNSVFNISENDQEDEEETNKLLETGLNELQNALSTENKRQSTLALLALLTSQRGQQHGCSDQYLEQYLDPNGEYNPHLAIFAAAIYDDDGDDSYMYQPQSRSCQDIIVIAEEMLGPSWLEDFHKEKGCMLRKMLEKLAFVAKIRIKVRDQSKSVVTR